jgi:hypothetical protein
MMLLPPPAGKCPICAVKHGPREPHNAQSLYYQYRFYGIRGRWPTWADAIAHCNPKVQADWKLLLSEGGHWTEPAEGDPIADPPEESVNQPIGDINHRGFGPEHDPAVSG